MLKTILVATDNSEHAYVITFFREFFKPAETNK